MIKRQHRLNRRKQRGFIINPFAFGAGGVSPIAGLFAAVTYTGDGTSSKVISCPGVDLTGGGLIMIKSRNGTQEGVMIYTPNGSSPKELAAFTEVVPTPNAACTFGNGSFTLTSSANNVNGRTYVAWVFKKAATFLDIVTYSGNGTARNINHNLTTVPKFMIVAANTVTTTDKQGYHVSLGNTTAIRMWDVNILTGVSTWGSTTPTSSVFRVGTGGNVNASGSDFVCFLFGEGPTSEVAYGTYTGNGNATGPVVNTGFEPQAILFDGNHGFNDGWIMLDQARNPGFSSTENSLIFSSSATEAAAVQLIDVSGSGFQIKSTSNLINRNASAYIYMAIKKP